MRQRGNMVPAHFLCDIKVTFQPVVRGRPVCVTAFVLMAGSLLRGTGMRWRDEVGLSASCEAEQPYSPFSLVTQNAANPLSPKTCWPNTLRTI